jgi:hypothetical protein
MPSFARLPLWIRCALGVLALLAVLRGAALIMHQPLVAFGNNYDQFRYTVCLDLTPWRPGVAADLASPRAPQSRFAFQPLPTNVCVWTSDLLFSAPVVLAWRLSEQLGGRPIHSIRRLGELRLFAWLLVASLATFAFLRARRPDLAVAHLTLFALVGMDPANLLYFSTFYAEAAAVFGFYVCLVASGCALLRPTRGALACVAVGALLLATSKLQHLLLPAALAAGVWIVGDRTTRRVALALTFGAALGCAVQVGQELRSASSLHWIDKTNQANFMLSLLLPETSDRAHVTAALELEEGCVAYAGASVYMMPSSVALICTHIEEWSHAKLWWLLISDPPALLRALAHIPRSLLPWSQRLGMIEGGNYASLPASLPSLSDAFGGSRAMAMTLLALPWLVFAIVLLRRGSARARAFAILCACGSTAVVVVALFGDGDVDFAKHAHLSIDFALASLAVPIAALVRSRLPQDALA